MPEVPRIAFYERAPEPLTEAVRNEIRSRCEDRGLDQRWLCDRTAIDVLRAVDVFGQTHDDDVFACAWDRRVSRVEQPRYFLEEMIYHDRDCARLHLELTM